MIVWCVIIQMKPFEVLFCVTVTLHLELFSFKIFLKIVTPLSIFQSQLESSINLRSGWY